MNVCIGSVVEGETEAHRGEPSGLVAHAGRILSLPSAQALLCHSLMDWGRGEAGESSLFLLSISLTFSADWAAPLEVVCPQIGATGPDWGGGLRGAGTRPAASRHPGWFCTIVLSWPTTRQVMTLTQRHARESEDMWGNPRCFHRSHCLCHGITTLPNRGRF